MNRQPLPLFDASKLTPAFPSSHRYLIGVSGGRDSVALLQALVDLGYKKLVVCHLNHQLRGKASDADARFVGRLVTDFQRQIVGQARHLPKSNASERSASPPNISFESGSTDVAAIARRKRISIETAAREARYSFFAKIARKKKCRTIFLGHHADDLVETFMINLFRGSGTTGLGAMREVWTRRIDTVRLTIVRPLLGTWREDIDSFVRRRRLKFREDASNKNLVPMRNRVRRQIVPYLEKTAGRNIRKTIWRAATIAAEEEALLEEMSSNGKQSAALQVNELRALPAALQRRAILKWLRGRNVSGVSFDVVERVRSLLNGASQVAKVNLPKGRHARRRAKKIFIEN